jgi:hypothetical protein
MPEPSVSLKDYVDARDHELLRQLEASTLDRGRIREELGGMVRQETFQLAVDRIGSLERTVSRLYGGLVVLTALLSVLGVVLRYLVG